MSAMEHLKASLINETASVRILIVDDHPNTAATMARAVSRLGKKVEVLTAESGEQALDLVRERTVDLLITDMVMPGINGLELIEKLQVHPGGRPAYTALVTAYDVPGLKESARRLKVNDVINKPVRPERVCQIVARAIEELGQVPVAPAADSKPQLKILVADDQPDNVTLLSRYLENEGYICLTAFNGDQALAQIRTEMPDLVLLDVNMPVKDGFEALQDIRSDPALAHIPVIILTAARIEPVDMQYALSIGADDYVTKPFDRRELLARIRTRLRVKEAEDLIRRRNKELNLLPEIGRELGARLDVDQLIDLVLRRTVETLGALIGHIVLLTPGESRINSYALSASTSVASQVHLPALADLLTQIEETRQGIIITDAHQDSRWKVAPEDPTRAVVLAPMFGRQGLLGLLILIHEQAGYFLLEHKLLLQAIASQAAIAVENALFHHDVVQEQQRLFAVLENAADAILMFDADGRIRLSNPAGEKLFASGQAQVGSLLPHGMGYDNFLEMLGVVCISGKAKKAEILWPDQRVFDALFTPIADGGCVAILTDISQFKMREAEKDEFMATAIHGLKNPLTKIRLMTQLISSAGPLNEKQMQYLKHIYEAAGSMGRFVPNLIELAKIDGGRQALTREPVKMNNLVFETTEEFRLQAEAKQQRLSCELSRDGPVVEGDPYELQQALRNLVNNALKYTPEKGTIFVSVQAQDGRVTINVQDDGYGIPPKDLPFIFDRFYRAHDEHVKDIEGNGLGLAIVKSIVKQHNGNVEVDTEPGKGSCFAISFPLAPLSEPAEAPKK
jgi:two-component system phosphate regulon sensor histidine kinase PhoR